MVYERIGSNCTTCQDGPYVVPIARACSNTHLRKKSEPRSFEFQKKGIAERK